MERLTDDRFLKDGFYQPTSKDEEKEIRSMGKDLTFEKLYRHCAELEKKNAELQKQVDERENEIDRLEKVVHDQAEQYWDCKEQAVKDTAKEIWTNAVEGFVFSFTADSEDYKNGYDKAIDDYDNKLQEFIKERYGVEVE